MEFQVAATAGRLAAIAGEEFVEQDIYFRRCGMTYAAEKELKEILADPETRLIIEAYTDGVNAFIQSIDYRNLPMEYKLLDYYPEPWTFLKSALLSKFMAWNLTAFDISELMLTRARSVFGENVVDDLRPIVPPFTDPVIPREVRWPFRPVSIPKKPTRDFVPITEHAREGGPAGRLWGGNNWAIAPHKTATGYPILCTDFHLPLYLPCMWYEIQLATPDMNVYGVSLPGVPLVMVGFNEYVAWGATNAMTDVIDWYEIEFKDDAKSSYLHDSAWLPTRKRIEEIKVRNREVIIDTVVYTHHGPVVYGWDEKPYADVIPRGCAMRWVGHDPSNELKTFLELNRARDYQDCRDAIASYDYPGLNFAFACVDGDVALWHTGKFPIRWPGQGRYINDGRNSAYDWHEWIPKEHLPHVLNPMRGYVSSANQYPVGERYPYYLGSSYWSFDRGARINERLSKMSSITYEDMIELQNDVVDISARMVLPFLLANIDETKLMLQERTNYEELTSWNYDFRIDLIAPTIFAYWWKEMSNMIWLDEVHTSNGDFPLPRSDVTMSFLLNNPNSEYFDVKDTPGREQLKDIVVKSFHSASNKLFEDLGSYGDNWRWGNASKIDIEHLAQIKGLGRMGLTKAGNGFTINVKHSSFLGRSWRMVVALGSKMQGWGIYPGGQSGNPGSKFYDNFIDDWLADKVYEFIYLESVDTRHERLSARTILRSGS
jgi:penicillin amidase